jgi:hypothetical protein
MDVSKLRVIESSWVYIESFLSLEGGISKRVKVHGGFVKFSQKLICGSVKKQSKERLFFSLEI